jgi:predicted GTPase
MTIQRTITRATFWTKNEKRLFVTFKGEKEQGVYNFDKKTLSNMTKEEANTALAIIKSAKNSNSVYEADCEAYYYISNTPAAKRTDEEDLDQLSRKQKVEYKDKSDMSYEG